MEVTGFGIPVDLTFMSQVIYEGLLVYKRYGNSFLRAFESIRNEIPENARLGLVGNDLSMIKKAGRKGESHEYLRKGFLEQILMYLDPSKYTESEILERVKNKKNYSNLFDPDFISELLETNLLGKLKFDFSALTIEISKNRYIIGSDEITAPQLMKVDRYTGFTSLESKYTTSQITVYVSIDVALLFLLGVYSAFIASVTYQKNRYYYFLFFYPDEILKLLDMDPNVIEKYFIVKNQVKSELNNLVRRTFSNEIILLDLLVDLDLHSSMIRENLDKLSLNLMKIAGEGRIYKIYEHVPINIFKEPRFISNIRGLIRDTEELLRHLSNIVNPDSVLMNALNRNFPDSDNALRALQALYKFILLGDSRFLLDFVHELKDAYLKLRNSSDKRHVSRSYHYLRMIRGFTLI